MMRRKNEEGRMKKLRIHKGDLVKVIAGSHKGKTGKVVKTSVADQKVYVDGIGVVKRKVKPSQLNPRGGTKEIHRGLPVSNVVLVTDEAKGKTTKVAYKMKENKKVRVARSNGKEL